ncbi:MAG TPA: hypothetical protein VI341_10445 [Actinomycetota bacterium]
MTDWLLWWFVIAILTTVAMVAFVVALVRHVLLLGRTARRMQEEISPIANEITAGVDRASSKASSFQPPSFGSRDR